MSYAVSSALQTAVYQRLAGDTAVAAATGGAIYDNVPGGVLPETYVTLGPEDVTARNDRGTYGSRHDFMVSVFSDSGGFQTAKDIGAAISNALVDADLMLSQGRLVSLDFLKARARRSTTSPLRQIDLWFRARVDDE